MSNQLSKELSQLLEDQDKNQDGSGNDNNQDDGKQQQQQSQDATVLQKELEKIRLLMEQQQQQQQPKEKSNEPEDKDLEALLKMTPEQRANWALEKGHAGVLKLLELQDKLIEEKLEQKTKEALSVAERAKHEALIEQWAGRHKELFENPEIASVVEGVEGALLAKRGVKSVFELPLGELEQHLTETIEKAKIVAKNMGLLEGFKSVGDVGGAAPPTPSGEIDLSKIDALELENLSVEQLRKLEQKILGG